jgi:hypothetical protein
MDWKPRPETLSVDEYESEMTAPLPPLSMPTDAAAYEGAAPSTDRHDTTTSASAARAAPGHLRAARFTTRDTTTPP